MKMDNNEVSTAVDAIWEMRNPSRIKAKPKDFRYADSWFKDRSKVDCKEADIADEKELQEVWQ